LCREGQRVQRVEHPGRPQAVPLLVGGGQGTSQSLQYGKTDYLQNNWKNNFHFLTDFWIKPNVEKPK
jgi:hypothetical protein